jgi:hypothetical protein
MLQTLSLSDVAVGGEAISDDGKAKRVPAIVAGTLLGDVTVAQLIGTIYRSNPNEETLLVGAMAGPVPTLQAANSEEEEE